MLSAVKQHDAATQLKLVEDVRKNDQALAAAAAKMNADLSMSLRTSRMLTAFALTMCAFMGYVMRHEGKTIGAQQQLIRQLFQDNQQMIHERMANPPATAQPESNQPAEETPAPASNSKAGEAYRADGCVGGTCA